MTQENLPREGDSSEAGVYGIITDAELSQAWGNAKFGDVSKRDVIIETLKKVAQAWGTGHTAMCIVKELGLVEQRNGHVGLSDKGLKYLLSTPSVGKEDKK